MEKSSYSIVEMGRAAVSALQGREKGRGKNAKQFTWVLLLRAHRAAGCVAWPAATLWALLRAAKKRLELRQSLSGDGDKVLFRFIKGFLALSLATLLVEIVAHWKGWHFQGPLLPLPETEEIKSWMHAAYLSWLSFRSDYIASPIQSLSSFCVVLFIIQSLDRTVLCLGCLWIKLKGIKPTIDSDPFKSDDPESPTNITPWFLFRFQCAMRGRNVEQSMTPGGWKSCAGVRAIHQCNLPVRLAERSPAGSGPRRLRRRVHHAVDQRRGRQVEPAGVNIVYRHRLVRTGYKAGNLKSAMSCDYVKEYEFVAIFDADFQPNRDFLTQTIPHFQGDPELGLVQARWSFVNKDENLLTRLQNVNLCFHFEVEQQVNGVFLNFFGFNGTAGVWRRKALEESGGWLERTTVEDMDIAVRAHLCGWKFIFLNDVKVLCELPECYEAYRKQQHRWHSGPMQLFRLCLPTIIKSKVPTWKKANLILLFFLLRKLILPFYSFTLFCVILPLTMFVPEAELPPWVICYIPFFMSFLNILPAPRSFPFIVPYLLFENTMSVTKFHAMVSGLFQLGSSYEWIVTKKAGRSSEPDLLAAAERESKLLTQQQLHRGASESELAKLNEQRVEAPPVKKKANKIYRKELFLALLLLTAAVRSLLSAQGIHFYFLLFQGISFLLVGLDLVGEQIT
ncbi:unnamed protein product [Spirodela intermedia]|uniref:glucomannan 4-beta-mannosyltransferase n=1 Tax=Spirodela intermedia TaxID=51605 RepID=A0A7I8IWY0_SPIIN|nr:unnamed protein product [Spirodela intermedia]CAA6662291.1 unnamed protein product [Spirodela intermedia]